MFAVRLGADAELRPLEPWQAGEFAAHVELARAFLEPWLPWAREVVDEETAHGFLQPYADRQSRDEGRIYGIWLGGRLVGGALFRVFDADAGVAEIGAWLDPGATGRGLVTNAVRHMIDWALDERGLHRIEWHCAPANVPSIAVAKRLGMSREGVLRQAFNNNGRLEDLEIWALLVSDRSTGLDT